MDRISGLMPQIGWSPLLTPAAPKKAPASTVEPAAKSANINSGMGAEVDTQTPEDRAQQVSDLKAQVLAFAPGGQMSQATTAASMAGVALAAGLMPEGDGPSQMIEPPPDPDAPTGPPPTFDVTPLEAAAARRLDPPETVPTEVARIAPPEPEASDGPAATAAPVAPRADSAPPPEAPAPAPEQVTTPEAGSAQGDWQRLEPEAAEPSLDVTR
ncbi:MAG: hypothetical protein IE922_12495 [Sphingomonadales bacterium]|nr:hypothetical protein [Sphingomonadales bacterium]